MRILKNRLTISTVAFVLAAAGILAQQPPAGGSPTPPPGAPQTPGGRGPGGGRGPTPGGFERIPPRPFPDAPEEQELSGTKYRVVPVVSGLANPWSLTFLPNGDMLVTEKAWTSSRRPQWQARSRADQGDADSLGGGTGRFARGAAASPVCRQSVPLPDLLEAVPHRQAARPRRSCAASSTEKL